MKSKTGQSLVELVVVMGLSAILIPVVFAGFITAQEGKPQQQQRAQAVGLVHETEEALRSIRERDWTLVASTGTYHPIVSGGSWALAAGNENINGFTRSIVISDVFRNDQGVIVVPSGGTRDPSTKAVTVTVSWSTPRSSFVSSTGYLTRYLDNLTFVQTTDADFNAGTLVGTAVTNTSGGEVILGAGGYGDWCNPVLTITPLDLPKSGVANAITAIEGRAFVGTGENASGESFVNIGITNDNPPSASILGTFSNYKTSDVFGESNYGYIATDTNSKEVVIVNLSSSPYSEIGYFNTPFSSADATSIWVSGNRGYVTAGIFLYIFDLSSKTGSRPIVGWPFLLFGTGTSVVVNGSYAYVSISGSPIELQIIDITNPWRIFQSGYADVNGQDGKRVFVNQTATRAYLVTNESSTKPEFFVIDTTGKSGSRPTLGSYDANGMNPKNLAVVSGNKAIIVGTGGEEYQVLDITNESNPSHCGGLNHDVGINGIASVLEQDGDAYSYIITGDANAEFKIIEGGPGGRYASNGTFESSIFDAGYSVAFNRFDTTTTAPVETSLTFQVAGADAVSGNCSSASFTFVGPDKTSATFFTAGSAMPLDDDGISFENPSRCFRYKGYFSTSDVNQTPVFSDITVNYSP